LAGNDVNEVLTNIEARHVFLDRQGLLQSPRAKQSRADLLSLIEKIGFVQVDSISTVERAHHMIMFSRNQTYRRENLVHLLEKDASLFENWTHDASLIPTVFFPYWRHRFERSRVKLLERWKTWRREGFEDAFSMVREQIRENGSAMSRDFLAMDKDRPKKQSGGWWDWHPSKTALEYLWRTGELAVSAREGFQKRYDLAERVIPEHLFDKRVDEEEFIDWACRSALSRLGMATPGELAAFWALISPAEAKIWSETEGRSDLIEVNVECVKGMGPRRCFTTEGVLNNASGLPAPPARIRVISPFDPVIRDRQRLSRLFGFEYRIEVFVPAAKRKYGYYVFPLLEGDRFIGRIDMKHFRDDGDLRVCGLWLEEKVKFGDLRRTKLAQELERIRRFIGAERVTYLDGYLKS